LSFLKRGLSSSIAKLMLIICILISMHQSTPSAISVISPSPYLSSTLTGYNSTSGAMPTTPILLFLAAITPATKLPCP